VNVLICLDHSASSRKAVEFAGRVLGKASIAGLSVTLFHVAELLPEYLLTDQPAPGLTSRELAKMWEERARGQGERLLQENRQFLIQAGLPREAVREKLSTTSCLPEAKKVASALAIIDEVTSSPYDVVCLGRRGATELKSSIIGGVAEKVIRECQGKTVWLVD
jgi:nucleotide-binding universal stress UspA family protein